MRKVRFHITKSQIRHLVDVKLLDLFCTENFVVRSRYASVSRVITFKWNVRLSLNLIPSRDNRIVENSSFLRCAIRRRWSRRPTLLLSHSANYWKSRKTSPSLSHTNFAQRYRDDVADVGIIVAPGGRKSLIRLTVWQSPRAVPRLGQLITGPLLRRPVFDPTLVHMGFVVEEMALIQVLLQVLSG